MHFLKNTYLTIVIVVFFACNNEENDRFAYKLKRLEYLKEISFNLKLGQLHGDANGIYVSQINNVDLKTGEPLFLAFLQAKYIDFIEFIDEGSRNYFYKLYLNERYAGKYEVNKKVGVHKSVESIRIMIAKKGEERIVEGWDKNYDYVYITDTSKNTSSKQRIAVNLSKDKNTVFRAAIEHRKARRKLPSLNKRNDFTDKGNILLLKSKKDDFIVEQSVDFKRNGTFFVNYIKANKKSKKIIYEYFLHGNWRLIKTFKNRTKVELDGEFSGKPNESQVHKVSLYKKRLLIDSLNIIRSDDFLDGVMLDLPNWVMVNLVQFNNDFIIDIPYATTQNITGMQLYECNKCYLLYQTVKDLLKAQELFEKKGFKVKLLDCYRPFDVQKILYNAFPVSGYVADPIGGSIHNRGTAVDLTLVDADGNELNMGSEYDELSVRSNHGYIGFEDTVLQNRKLLRETMNSCNFVTIRLEWWHYNHQFARKFPKLNDDFPCDIKK